MKANRTFREADDGVSEIIATLLLIAVTVIVITVFNVVVVQTINNAPTVINAEFRVDTGSEHTFVTLTSGDLKSEVRILFFHDNTITETDYQTETGLQNWTTNSHLCLTCIQPTWDEVVIVYHQQVIYTIRTASV